MRTEWIEDILAVMDYGSFSAAAQARLLTPSAFTRRIRTIEEALGTPLFDRDRKPVELRPHVARLEPDLREAAERLGRLRTALSTPGAGQLEQVTLMCQHALAAAVAPSLVRLMGRGSDLMIAVADGTRAECRFSLLQREVDFALIYQSPDEDLAAELGYLDSLTLGTESFAPVAALGQDPRLQDEIAQGRVPAILYPDDIYLGEILRRKIYPRIAPGIEIQTVVESGLTLAVVEFVRRGMGVAWLPLTIVARELAAGEMTVLDRLPSCNLKVNLLMLSGNPLPRCARYWDAVSVHAASTNGSIADFVRNGG